MTPRPGQSSRWYIWKSHFTGGWIVNPPLRSDRLPEFFATFEGARTAFANGGKL